MLITILYLFTVVAIYDSKACAVSANVSHHSSHTEPSYFGPHLGADVYRPIPIIEGKSAIVAMAAGITEDERQQC
eukprot:5250756-Prorocentrum_lima.AAC.1